MKFLILLLNVLSFWLMADVAHAEPISLAIAAISQFVGSIGLIGKLVLTVAINIGLSLVEKAMAKKDQPQPAGAKLEISMGDDHPMSFIIGSHATAGRRKYAGSWGEDGKTPNAYFTDVIEIGSIPNRAGERGLTSLWIDDQQVGVLWEEPHPDGRGFPVLQYRVGSTDYLWIKFLDGTQTAPDPFLTTKFGVDPDRPWKSTMIGLGCQVVILTARYNADLFSGIPAGVYQPHPVPLYDIRKDTSAGGNGAHRWEDPSTWEQSGNPATLIYNLARGVYYGSEWVYGGQNIAAFCLPSANWMAAANACDASVTLDGGGSEPAFRAGYEVQCDQQPLDVVSELLKACNGRMAEVGGIFKMLISTPGAAVYSFSDDDIIVTAEQDFQPFPSLSDTYNAIEATYPEPAEKWANKDAPGRYNADLEVEDGNRRLPAQIQLPAVPFANQVQRVGQAMIQDYRRFRTHQISLPPDAYPLEPNDVVSWTSARNGYDEKKFLVVKVEPQPNFVTVVTLKEVDPSDYDWHSGMQLPTAIGWIGPITPPSQPMVGWSVEPATVQDTSGVDRRAAIKISCAPDLDDVERVWVQVRLKETGDIVFDSDSTRYASPYSWTISGQWTLPDTDYEARGRYVPRSTRATDWSAWLTVKTPNILIQAGDVLDGAIIAAKIADAAVTAEKIMDEAVTSLKLADAAVSANKIAVDAVTADVIASNAVVASKLADAAVTLSKIADGAVIASKLADAAVTASKIADAAVTATKFAAGLTPVEIVDTLPTTGNFEGRQALLTTDGKLYRYHAGAWTAAVNGGDITGIVSGALVDGLAAAKVTGQLTDAQIAAVAAAKVSGQLVSSQLSDLIITQSKLADAAVIAAKIAAGAIDASKLANGAVTATAFASGLTPVEIVSALPTSGNFQGRTVVLTTDNKLYRYNGSAWTSAVPSTDVTGQLTDAQIAAVAAAKVTGTLVSSQIADAAITVAKFAAGNRPVEIVSALPTTGNVEGRLVYLTTDDKLYRYTGSAFTAAVAATDMTGQITTTQITDGAISTPKIATGAVTAGTIAAGAVTAGTIVAGAVTATEIAANAITADKLYVGDTTSYVANPSFTDGDADGWTFIRPTANIVTAATAASVPTGAPSPWVLKSTGYNGGNTDNYWTDYTPVVPGETYYIEAWVQTTSDVGNSLNFGIHYRDVADTTSVWSTGIGLTAAQGQALTAWTKISHIMTVPATVNGTLVTGKGRLWFSVINSASAAGSWFITNIRMRKAAAWMRSLPTSAIIGSLQVGRSNISAGAISRVDYSGLGSAGVGTSDTAITGLTVNHGTGTSAVLVHSAFSLAGTGTTDGNGVVQPVSVVVSIYDSANNAYSATIELNFMGKTHFAHEYNFTPPAASASTTFRFDVRVVSGSGVTANNRTIRVLTLYGK
ncbi:MAG: hypothetical protein KGI75_04140 [Rhizobiaceae bacterium]|nr:hypothetical protein [Rhizobiaceae bacterium]